jgi:hypothetical protein
MYAAVSVAHACHIYRQSRLTESLMRTDMRTSSRWIYLNCKCQLASPYDPSQALNDIATAFAFKRACTFYTPCEALDVIVGQARR